VASTRIRRIPALISASVMATVLAATAAGCAGAGPAASQPESHSSASPSAVVQAVVAAQPPPIPQAVASKLGRGYVYLLAGPDPADENVWAIGGRTERQLTFGTKNNAVTSVGAAAAGVVVSDDRFNADDLAEVTNRGAWWLPTGLASRLRPGCCATISASGKIAFVAVPRASGRRGSDNFELRDQDGFTSKSVIIYTSRTPLSDPVFGPANQIAFIRQPKTGDYDSTTVIVRSADGKLSAVKTGFTDPDSLVWSANAPDLVVTAWPLKAEAISSGGRRMLLPAGWFPMAWNPAGTRLLVASTKSLGLWAPASPARVRTIGALSPGVEVGTASWLDRPASLRAPSARRS
jgi:hypothetical protein